MKKLLTSFVLMIFIFQYVAMAANMPDPDFYFNNDALKTGDGDVSTYIYEFGNDPFNAAEAYVCLLMDSYGFELSGSYVEESCATWRLTDGTHSIRIDYDRGDGYWVYMDFANDLTCLTAEAWDWYANSLAGSGDVTVLPDFLSIDSTGKYHYAYTEGDSKKSIVFESGDMAGCYEQAEAYVSALVAMGYQIVETERKDYDDWDMEKWYLHSGLSGLGNIETGVDAHVRVRINSYHDKDKNSLSVYFVDGIAMTGYDDVPAANNGDGGDEDCFYCKDGACKKCDGTGQVLKNVPGTAEWIYQSCTRCSAGQCMRCGGDGKN